jgi:hypothetical protein
MMFWEMGTKTSEDYRRRVIKGGSSPRSKKKGKNKRGKNRVVR